MSSIRTLLKRIMLSSAFFGIFSYASQNLVNGIAFFVNGEPVTLLELYSTIQGAKVTQDVAIDMLINKQLHDQETKKRNIQVSNLEIDNEIERIAKQHQTTSEEIHTYIENSGKSWESYKEEIKDSLIKAKLYQDITRENLRLADERELREYYQSHQEEFSIPENIEVFKFYSKDPKALENTIKNKGKMSPKVFKEKEVLEVARLNPQIVRDFTRTRINAFTPIYPIDGEFISFLILDKNNPQLLPFENVKNAILEKMMTQKEDYIIYEHFEKLRSNAKINILRLD